MRFLKPRTDHLRRYFEQPPSFFSKNPLSYGREGGGRAGPRFAENAKSESKSRNPYLRVKERLRKKIQDDGDGFLGLFHIMAVTASLENG